MASKKHRWKCPLCGHGVLLGPRPRKTATKRYCLPCSETTGTLVERTAPSLDKKRQASTERRKEAASRKAEAAVAAVTYGGVHVPRELEALWKVARRLVTRRLPVKPPELVLLTRHTSNRTSGHAYYNASKVALTIPRAASRASVLGLIVHEVAHPMVPGGHTDEFWTAVAELSKEAYGVDLPVLEGTARQKYDTACAAMHAATPISRS